MVLAPMYRTYTGGDTMPQETRDPVGTMVPARAYTGAYTGGGIIPQGQVSTPLMTLTPGGAMVPMDVYSQNEINSVTS